MKKILIILSILFIFGCLSLEDILSEPNTFSLSGKVLTLSELPIENAKVELTSNITKYTFTNSKGEYSFSNITAGDYLIKITKEGFREMNLTFTFYPGDYTWNFTLVRDCIYYDLYANRDYIVRYGYNGTIHRSKISCKIPYPENSFFNFSFPDTKQGIFYIASNRMLRLEIDNLNNRYNSIGFYFLISMNGTNSIKIYDRRNMSIEEVGKEMPLYLGERTMDDGNGNIKKIIDPENERIKSVSLSIREKAGDNAWDVARELFIWLKNNTSYFNAGGAGREEYIQSPSEMMDSRKGDCDELSYLYISLLRASGIPSRYVEGFLAKENESTFVRHMWVEFYDGEWVPVEVAGTGKPEDEANVNFGININQHVPIFVDDGTESSFNKSACTYEYYGIRPSISSYTYYNSIPYNQSYLAICGDKRFLTDKKE